MSEFVIVGASCMCALLALMVVGGLGYFLMKKKSDAPAEQPPGTPGPAGIRGPEHPTVPDPTTTISHEIPSPEAPDPSEILEPDSEPVSGSDPIAAPDPVVVPAVEPVPTPVIDTDPLPQAPDNVIQEPIPDPSGILGLDPPIIAAETLEDDETESPTVIIPREPKDEEDA